MIKNVENTGWIIQACSPDAQGTFKRFFKKSFIYTDNCVWSFTKHVHAFLTPTPSLCFKVFPGPPTRSCFMEQLMGVLQQHDQQRSQSADELQTKPREGLRGMSHIASIHSPEADRVTEQCSGNITKTLLNFCLSRSLFLPAPSSFPGYLYWFALRFLSLSHLTPPLMSRSQLSVLPKSNSICGLR